MPLKKQVVTMPFAKGLNEKLGDGVVPIGELTQAENVRNISWRHYARVRPKTPLGQNHGRSL